MMETQKKNIPELRFPEFEEEWERERLREIYSFFSTNSYSRENLNYLEGSVKNIHYGDIHTKFQAIFDVEIEVVPFINPNIDISKIPNLNYCQEGDVIIADASEDYKDIGKAIELVNLNGEKVLSGLHTILARPNNNVIKKGFSSFLFQSWSVKKQLMTIAQGIKVLGLSTKRLAKITISTPTLPEQQKIAAFLTAVDKKLQALRKKKALLEQYKKGVMQKIFSRELRFKKEYGKDFPEWEEKKLKDLATFFSGGTPKSTISEFYSGMIPFIKSGEIHLEKTEQFLSEKGLKESSAKMVDEGDLLYALYGANSGEIAISKIKGAINQAVLCIRPNIIDKVVLYFFLYYSRNKIVGRYLQGGQGNLSANILKEIKIPKPSVKEQTQIANFLSAIDKKIASVEAQIEKTGQWKKGLLQRMFV